jgi:hypothetical protein
VNLHPHIVNEKLNVTPDELIALGFKQTDDGTDHPFGIGWMMENDQFCIDLDCTYVVKLTRKNPDTDPITLYVESKLELESLIDWIA